ncbi:MAG TPA: hypothetical protein PLN48_12410 [Lachnospiraceae bacterium]|nr:hypothetical protein [Lachnospiraceae bacterium]
MTTKNYIQIASITLLASVMFEITLLAGLAPVPEKIYHFLHIFLMLVLIVSQILLYKSLDKNKLTSKYALWFALGMGFTAIGDYVNGANSCIEPVSNKLTWALLLFGSGYVIYNFILWKHATNILAKTKTSLLKYKYYLAVPFIVINLISWMLHVEPNLNNPSLLYYGSFIFNLTIYVAMPLFAAWYYYGTGWSTRGLVIFIAAILIPYSDLVLFNSWMKNGSDPAVPSIQLYAYNWILYFGGQTLMSMLPSFIVMDETEN